MAKTVAELVDNLFRTHLRQDGREYTYKDISVALQGIVEPSHLSKLRTGKISNPGRDTLLALCRFFQVPPSYFFPELDGLLKPEREDETSATTALSIPLRSNSMRPEVEQKLKELIQALQKE